MKKLIVTCLLLFLLALASCADDAQETLPEERVEVEKEHAQQTTYAISDEGKDIYEQLYVVNDAYDDPMSSSATDASLSQAGVYDINSYLGFPEGNVMKVHSVCYDEDVDLAYAVSIMSENIAVISNDKVTEYVATGLDAGSYGLKYVYCGNGHIFVVNDQSLVHIDAETLATVDSITFDKEVFSQAVHYEPTLDVVFVPIPEVNEIIVLDVTSFSEIARLDLSRAWFSIDDGALVAIENDLESVVVKWFDTDDYTLQNTQKVETPGNLAEALHVPQDNSLWFIDPTHGQLLVYDLNDLAAKPVAINGVVPDPHKIVLAGDHVIVTTDNGFGEDEPGFIGGFSLVDIASRSVVDTVMIPYKHSTVSYDAQHDEIYLSNNDGGSITRYDVFSGEIVTIDVGNAAEGGVVLSDGTVYVRNRLAGSTLLHLDPYNDDLLTQITTNQWPVGIAYDEELDRVFTYDFLEGKVSVVDPSAEVIVDTYDTTLPYGSTDGIGSMIYDYTRHVLFTVIPEQNKMEAIDAKTGTTIALIDLVDYDTRYEELSGAGTLVATLYEPTAQLFVYVKETETIYVYDGLNRFKHVGTLPISQTRQLKYYPYGLYVDQYEGLLYVGSAVIDIESMEEVDTLTQGDAVIAVDHNKGIVLTVSEDRKDQEWLHVLSLEGELLDETELAAGQYVNALFDYSSEYNRLYAFYLISGEVWAYDVE